MLGTARTESPVDPLRSPDASAGALKFAASSADIQPNANQWAGTHDVYRGAHNQLHATWLARLAKHARISRGRAVGGGASSQHDLAGPPNG
ncbi:MAG TPA: hypothetical protein VIC05_01815 [Solirubrobacteraceae bacterium]|jgi:hypothetical protein